MGRRTEPLTEGLVTQPDASLLKPGQLTDMRNLIYVNGANAAVRAPGRSAFGTVSAVATSVYGIRDITFDTGDRYLIAAAGNKYRTAYVSGDGTFSDLATVTQGTSLEVVHYRNRFFLMNGVATNATGINSNTVVYMTGTAAAGPMATRQHGMLPVISAPATSTSSGAFTQTVTGYYEYWTTEVAEITQDAAQVKLESAFSSENGPTTVLVSSTAAGGAPLIQRPVVRNASTTHWRIYRSPKKDKYTDKKFPVGFMVFEGSTGTTGAADTLATASASSLPTQANNSGVGLFYGDFASASSAFTVDGVYASGTVGGSLIEKQQGWYGFTNLNTVAGSIKGIAVEVKAYVSSGSQPVTMQATIGIRNSLNGSFKGGFGPLGFQNIASKSIAVTATSPGQVVTLGDATDRWFPTNFVGLSDVDMTTSNSLMVRLSFSKVNTSIGVDYVKVYVYYGASVDSTVQYPTVVYNFGDIVSQVSKNMPPPSSDTGDLFQDQLVVNDVSNNSVMRWSAPGDPEAFPPTYFLDFETRDNDIIRNIKVVNNRLVVGLDSSIWRINYLPSERDASFDRGRAAEVISRSQGIVNNQCACTFTVDGGSEQLAFISNKGLCTTDGFNFITRSKQLQWRNHISVANGVTSTPIALLNDPERRTLRFIYRNDSLGNETYMCLWASYDRGDIDAEGNFKFSGPVHMRNYDSGTQTYASLDSAWSVTRLNGDTSLYYGYGGTNTAPGAGKVYIEGGTTIPANDSTCQFTTRRMYPNGLSHEWMLDDLYGYAGTYSGSPILQYTFLGTKTNDTGETTRGTKNITLQGGPLHHITPKVQVEGLRIKMQATATTFQMEHLVIGSTDFGLEDSGRSG